MNRNLIISTYEEETLLFKEHTTGLFEDNYLTYSTDNDTIRINLSHFSFTKENIETILKITSSDCTLILKELKKSLNITLEYLDYKYDNNHITIEYKLESQEKSQKIEIEIGEINNEI